MNKVLPVLVAMAAAIATSAFVATGAFAAVEAEGCKKPSEPGKCLWKVAGTKLAAGASEPYTATLKKGTKAVFKGKDAGTEVELTATGLISSGTLKGGNPGSGEAETTEFTGVKVVKPSKCTLETGETLKLPKLGIWVGWLISYPPFVLHGVDLAFLNFAKPGGVFTTLEFRNKGTETCALNGQNLEVTGYSGSEDQSETEAETQSVNFIKHPEKLWLFLPYAALISEEGKTNESKNLQLEFGGEEATFTAEEEVKLTSKKKYAVD
jgi:hypothetical protein